AAGSRGSVARSRTRRRRTRPGSNGARTGQRRSLSSVPGGTWHHARVTAHPIRFCRSADGTRLAFSVTGEGPPLVRMPHWLTHLEYECLSPVWQPWVATLERDHTLLRMDGRGCGLSDRDVANTSLEATLQDVEAVVGA